MILTKRLDGALIVTLNRSDKANALTAGMMQMLIDALRDGADAKAVILTGAGRVFSAGADLDAARAGLATSPLWEQVSGTIAALPCLTIAALNGTMAGGAFGMALACDLRIAVPGATFFYPVMRLGFLPQPSDPVRMRDLIGPAQTKRILMAGQKIDAPEALRIGLVDALDDDPLTLAKAWAGDVSKADAAHIGAIKAMI